MEEFWDLPRRTSEGEIVGVKWPEVTPWEVLESDGHYHRQVGRMFLGRAADQLLAPVQGTLEDWDLGPRLRCVRTATLVAVGRHDAVDIRYSRRIHRAIRGSRLVSFENSAHWAFLEERDLCMRTQRKFLDRHHRSGRSSR